MHITQVHVGLMLLAGVAVWLGRSACRPRRVGGYYSNHRGSRVKRGYSYNGTWISWSRDDYWASGDSGGEGGDWTYFY